MKIVQTTDTAWELQPGRLTRVDMKYIWPSRYKNQRTLHEDTILFLATQARFHEYENS